MYINTDTDQVVSEAQIRADNPNISFAHPFTPPGNYKVVFPAPQPEHNALTQSVREIAPVLTSKGHYEQAYEVIDLEPEIAATNVEAKRKQDILAQIAALEAKVTPRRMREAVRGTGKAWLDKLDDDIAALRASL